MSVRDVVICATGRASGAERSGSVLGEAGFELQPPPDSQPPAIAIVAHFAYSRKGAGKEWAEQLSGFDWTWQDALGADDNPAVLQEQQRKWGLFCVPPQTLAGDRAPADGEGEGGLRIENCVCLVNRGAALGGVGVPPSFYFVFTMKAEMLRTWRLVTGTLPAGATDRELLRAAKDAAERDVSVDAAALADLASRVVGHFTEPFTRLSRERRPPYKIRQRPSCASPFVAACPLLHQKAVELFDFTERSCLREAARRVGRQLVLPVGDALQEPFWPEVQQPRLHHPTHPLAPSVHTSLHTSLHRASASTAARTTRWTRAGSPPSGARRVRATRRRRGSSRSGSSSTRSSPRR